MSERLNELASIWEALDSLDGASIRYRYPNLTWAIENVLNDEKLITARSTVDRVRALLDEWNRLGRGNGVHGEQLRAILDPPKTDQSSEGEELLSFPAEWKPATLRLEGTNE